MKNFESERIEEFYRQDAKVTEKEEERAEEERVRIEPARELDELAHTVIGAAIEVHRHLGPGFLEGVYQEALPVEFRLRGVMFEKEKLINVGYKDIAVGEGKLDFLVNHCLIVELKAVELLGPIYKAQVISYLRATRLHLGLLMGAPTDSGIWSSWRFLAASQTKLRGLETLRSCVGATTPFSEVPESVGAPAPN